MTTRRHRHEAPPRMRRVAKGADLIAAVLERRGAAGVVRERRIQSDWRRIVGERVAQRAWPSALIGGVLHVRVANSAWLQELSFLRQAMITTISERLGAPPLVREIRLHLPGRGEPLGGEDELIRARDDGKRAPLAPAKTRPAVDAALARRIDDETAGVADDELRTALRALRRRLGQ